MVTAKRCSKCNITKPINEFSRDKYQKDHLKTSCKQCDQARLRVTYEAKNPHCKPYKEQRFCSLDGCDSKHSRNGYCKLHADRMRRHGNPYIVNLGAAQRPQTGPLNTGWKGSRIKYGSALVRVRRTRGQARQHPCVECGKQASQWAYNGTDPNELTVTADDKTAVQGMIYSAEPRFYQPMCRAHWSLLVAERRGARESRV